MAENRRIVYNLEFRTNVDDIENDIDSLENAYDDLTNSIGDANEELADTSESANGLNDVGDALGNVSNLWDDFTTNLRSGDIRGAFSNVRTGIQGATRAAVAFIATPIGAAIAALVLIGAATKEWFDFNNKIVEVNKNLEAITNITGDALDAIRLRATSLNDIFEIDLAESTKTAKKLVEQFGISYAEAFDTIEEGLIRGGTANDDYLESLSEYGVFFSKAGYSVTEFQGIVNAGFDLGIYSDKLPDALKEFDIKIREQTTATKDALVNSFGAAFSDELLNKVNTGAITTKEALELISEKANEVSLTTKEASTLTADLFGSAGEDAGGFAIVLEAVNEGLTSLEKPYNDIEEAQRKHIDNQKEINELADEAFKSDEFVNFKNVLIQGWDEIKIYVFERIVRIKRTVEGLTAAFTFLGNKSKILGDKIKVLFDKFSKIEAVNKYIVKFKEVLADATKYIDVATNKLNDFAVALGLVDSEQVKLLKTQKKSIELLNQEVKLLDPKKQDIIRESLAKLNKDRLKGIITMDQQIAAYSALIKVQKESSKIEDPLPSNEKEKEKKAAEEISKLAERNKKAQEDYAKAELDLMRASLDEKRLMRDTNYLDVSSLNTQELANYKAFYLQLQQEEVKYALAKLESTKKSALEIKNLNKQELITYTKQREVAEKDFANVKEKIITNSDKFIASLKLQNLDKEYKDKFNNLFKIKEKEDTLITQTAEERQSYLEKNAATELEQLQTTYDAEKVLLEDKIGFELENRVELDFAIQQLDIAKADAEVLLAEQTAKRKNDIDKKNKKALQKNEDKFFAASKQALGYWDDFDSAKKQLELNRAGDNAEKKDEIEKKYAEKKKARAIIGIIIDTAQSVIGAWRQWQDIPAPAGPIFAAAQSALVVGIGAAQISAVQSQPTLAEGGLLKGNLHNQGGIQYGGAEVEGGEFVINRASTQAFAPLIQTINDAGNGQGRSSDVKDLNLIDYDRLANAINDKKVYVTTKDLNESLDDDDKMKVRNTF